MINVSRIGQRCGLEFAMEQHLKILGWLYLGLSIFGWVASVSLAFGVGYVDESLAPSDAFEIGVSTIIWATLFFAPPMIGAVALLRHASWARGWMLLISVLSLMMFILIVPALLGAYGMWVLTRSGTKVLFVETAAYRDEGPNIPSPA